MSVSSASGTVDTQLTNIFSTNPKEFFQCMSFNFRMLLAFSVTLLLLCIFTSLLNVSFKNPEGDITCGRSRYQKCNCNYCRRLRYIENFSNDEMYSYKTAKESRYQNIPLLGDNLQFGQANRYVYYQDDKLIYRLEIFCNLLVLDGDIYPKGDKIKHKYAVFLENDQDKLYIGDLTKDGDGIYKLKFISKDNIEKLVSYHKLSIIYTADQSGKQKTNVVVSGHFN